MTLGSVLLFNLAAISCMCVLLWVLSLLKKDVSIVDIFWGIGFVIVCWLTILQVQSSSKAAILAVMVSIWGIRLSGYLAWRNHGKDEDYRYAAMREKHGSRFPLISLLTVFALQGVLMWVISLPVQVGIHGAGRWSVVASLGVACWFIGMLFESLGDYQLARFKSEPANKGLLMDQGLWRYTRHPNYFGDFMVWWGLFFVAVGPNSVWTIISPLIMSFLLIRVSGVRLLENSLRSRVAGYEEYVQNTSPFFPLPPKRFVADSSGI